MGMRIRCANWRFGNMAFFHPDLRHSEAVAGRLMRKGHGY